MCLASSLNFDFHTYKTGTERQPLTRWMWRFNNVIQVFRLFPDTSLKPSVMSLTAVINVAVVVGSSVHVRISVRDTHPQTYVWRCACLDVKTWKLKMTPSCWPWIDYMPYLATSDHLSHRKVLVSQEHLVIHIVQTCSWLFSLGPVLKKLFLKEVKWAYYYHSEYNLCYSSMVIEPKESVLETQCNLGGKITMSNCTVLIPS